MNLEHFIHVENNVISDDFCKQIIEEYDEPDDWKPGTINDYEINEYSKYKILSRNFTIQRRSQSRNPDTIIKLL